MFRITSIVYLLILFFVVLTGTGYADYITLIQADKCETIIEMRVEEQFVLMTYEIGEEDVQWFKNIIPIRYYNAGYSEENKRSRLQKFFSDDFIVTVDGRKLHGELIRTDFIERIPRTSLYTGKVDTTSKASKYVVFVEVKYPFKHKPKRISFTPPLRDGYDVTMANIGFVTYHKKIPINDIRYLGATETVNLNWTDPWYSFYDNKNIRRHHNNSIMSFLYIDPYEVRHEILSRVKDLEDWIDLGYGIDEYIEIADQENLKNKVANFLINRNIVTIDNRQSTPIIDNIHFVEVNMYGIQVVDQPKRMHYASAIIGVIFAYPDPGIPQDILINWDMFSENITNIPNTATDPAGPMKYILTPDDHILKWKNYLKTYKLPTLSEVQVTNASLNMPIFSLILILSTIFMLIKNKDNIKGWLTKRKGILITVFIIAVITFPIHYTLEIPFLEKKTFSRPEAEILIGELLKNTYRAFDFREESDIYDKLAISNEGELLSEVYLQTKKSMVIENQGGIRAKVKEVTIMDVEEVESNKQGRSYNCRWQVRGTVGHGATSTAAQINTRLSLT